MRAGIHDETAFLADQAIDVGRVQVDFAAALDHRVAKRHGESLLQVDERPGAFAGVDAAVPDFVLAGQVGGGQQLPVAHAAFGVQVGAVVPFPHALGAQADADRIQRAGQSGILARGLFLGGGGGSGFGRQRDALPEFLQRQLFIKTTWRGDRLEQLACLLVFGPVARRRCSRIGCCAGLKQGTLCRRDAGEQGPCAPV